MFKLIEGDTRGLADVERFMGLINSSETEVRDLFSADNDIFIARAPGRLDIMGGIADYSGSLVLEMPIAEATVCAVQKRNDRKLRIISLNEDAALDFEIDLSELERPYDDVRTFFSRDARAHWASYVAGVFTVLTREKEARSQNGASILISSDIPIGKGVSSSAAIEVSTMQAVCAAFDIKIEPLKLAMHCQKVENLVVGAPCGVMDQVTSHCGNENSILKLLCQPAEIVENIVIPEEIELWGIDSGVRHAVTGIDYGSVRVGAFIGYRLITSLAGFPVRQVSDGVVEVEDRTWRGYLSNIGSTSYTTHFESGIPAQMHGRDFLEKYGGITDRVTKIDPDLVYLVKAPTEHPIFEFDRIAEFSSGLRNRDKEDWRENLGHALSGSHASYAACGLTEPGTDRLVELVKENIDRGLYGARITGAGSGGTVAVAARAGSRDIIEEIAARYEHETGRKPYIFHGSSPGCAAFGYLRLSPFAIAR